MASDGKLSVEKRIALIKTLNSLTETEFKELVFALDPPSGVLPAGVSALGDRVAALLQWAEKSPTGIGLAKLQEVLCQILGKEQEPPSPSPDATFTEDLGNSAALEMLRIPEGRFWMGSPESEEKRDDWEGPQHRVSVPAFFMGKYPVIQRQWYAVSLLDDVDIHLNPDPSYFKGGNLPVEQVSWDDAVEFCKRLSKKTGKDYRLPSEAEWEYACRSGTTSPYHFGKEITEGLANHDDHCKGTTEVGKFPANPLGLHDMHGNVWEWCLDHWHENYEGAPTDGRAWVTGGDDLFRVVRGGSWINDPWYCRSASRYGDYPVNRSRRIGFRVCCSAPRTP